MENICEYLLWGFFATEGKNLSHAEKKAVIIFAEWLDQDIDEEKSSKQSNVGNGWNAATITDANHKESRYAHEI